MTFDTPTQTQYSTAFAVEVNCGAFVWESIGDHASKVPQTSFTYIPLSSSLITGESGCWDATVYIIRESDGSDISSGTCLSMTGNSGGSNPGGELQVYNELPCEETFRLKITYNGVIEYYPATGSTPLTVSITCIDLVLNSALPTTYDWIVASTPGGDDKV